MDIRVGDVPSIVGQGDRTASAGGAVEGKLLAVRAPRRRRGEPAGPRAEQRHGTPDRDPVNGRVLVLLIPDGTVLPEGLHASSHRVFLRFARR